MITVEVFRSYASALPGVEESDQHGLPLFKVAGEGFLGLEKSRTTAIVAVDEYEAGALVAGQQDLYEEVWRSGSRFVGLRVDLCRIPEQRFQELVVSAWRNKAPAELRAQHHR
jgi:hypothetical protein